MNGNKQDYLDRMDALKAAIEALPDDVYICSICRYFTNGVTKMTIQVLHNPNIQGEFVEQYDNGDCWYVAPGDIDIGYIVHAKKENSDDADT